MKHPSRIITATSLVVALLAVMPLGQAGDPPQSSANLEASPQLQRHHRMGKLMEQMNTQMAAMAKIMARGELTAQERQQMSEDMKRMTSVMRRMSGLTDRPSMREEDARKEFDAMEMEMAAMQKSRGRHEPVAK